MSSALSSAPSAPDGSDWSSETMSTVVTRSTQPSQPASASGTFVLFPNSNTNAAKNDKNVLMYRNVPWSKVKRTTQKYNSLELTAIVKQQLLEKRKRFLKATGSVNAAVDQENAAGKANTTGPRPGSAVSRSTAPSSRVSLSSRAPSSRPKSASSTRASSSAQSGGSRVGGQGTQRAFAFGQEPLLKNGWWRPKQSLNRPLDMMVSGSFANPYDDFTQRWDKLNYAYNVEESETGSTVASTTISQSRSNVSTGPVKTVSIAPQARQRPRSAPPSRAGSTRSGPPSTVSRLNSGAGSKAGTASQSGSKGSSVAPSSSYVSSRPENQFMYQTMRNNEWVDVTRAIDQRGETVPSSVISSVLPPDKTLVPPPLPEWEVYSIPARPSEPGSISVPLSTSSRASSKPTSKLTPPPTPSDGVYPNAAAAIAHKKFPKDRIVTTTHYDYAAAVQQPGAQLDAFRYSKVGSKPRKVFASTKDMVEYLEERKTGRKPMWKTEKLRAFDTSNIPLSTTHRAMMDQTVEQARSPEAKAMTFKFQNQFNRGKAGKNVTREFMDNTRHPARL